VWARAFGGTGTDDSFGVAVDAAGNVHTTGSFEGTVDFDPGSGVSNLTSAGDTDVFVSKLDADGNLVWARAFGGANFDQGFGVAVDAAGNVHTTGRFAGTADFDPGSGVANLTSAGIDDVFVSKLDSAGNLVWAHAFGGTSFDEGRGVAVDAAGNVHTTGWFVGTADFDPGSGVANLTSAGSADVFVSKLADPAVVRLAGANRFETAAAVAAGHHMLGAASAFVSTGANFPDALAGAAAAGLVGAPLLLTGSIPAATASALDALHPTGIVILGGTAVVSTADQTALGAWAPTTRLAGPNRYETAIAISQWAYPVAGSAEVVVVATGQNFPDALAAGAVATALGGPVLLTPTDSLHPDVATEISRLDPDLIIVAGGPAAINDAVFAQLGAIKPTVRVSGADRYATAVALSQHAFTDPDLVDIVYVAVGTNFPDALAGAAAAAATGSPVLLTPTGSLPQAVADEITRLNPTRIYILGGTAVISQAVEDQLTALLGL
jgi:putative cell wall-binding protein